MTASSLQLLDNLHYGADLRITLGEILRHRFRCSGRTTITSVAE
jgi:hypothetical protein